MDECVSGLHVVLVNDWCICQPRSCGATISQLRREAMDGRGRGRTREANMEQRGVGKQRG